MKNLKQFIEKVMSDDERDHHFTIKEKVIYGFIIPLALVAIMGIAGWMEATSEVVATIE